MKLRKMILQIMQGQQKTVSLLQFLGTAAEYVHWKNKSKIQVATAEVDTDEPKVSVTREAYDASGTETSALGLPCTTKTESFDCMVIGTNANGKVTVEIKDAFTTDELEVTDNASSEGLVALAAEIAEVQAQERAVPSGLTGNLTVPGFAMDEDSLTADLDTEDSDTIEPVESVELASALGRSHVYCYPLSRKVSYAGTLSGISVLCDGRRSMAGYGVEGAAKVAWVPLPYSYWMGLSQATRNLIAEKLGITALMGGDTPEVIAVSDGVIEKEDVLADASSRVFFDANSEGSTRQFADVDVDGDMPFMLWPDNKSYVIGILAAVPRVSMQSVIGLAAVCVGIGGGVLAWMVSANKAYGIPFANLVKAFGTYGNVIKLALDGKAYIKGNSTSYWTTDILPANGVTAEITIANVCGDRYWSNVIGTNAGWLYLSGSNTFGVYMNCTLVSKTVADNITVCNLQFTGSSSNGIGINSSTGWGDIPSNCYYYKVIITDTNNTKHLFIPVAVNTLLDLATNKVYTNQGTGTATLVIE